MLIIESERSYVRFTHSIHRSGTVFLRAAFSTVIVPLGVFGRRTHEHVSLAGRHPSRIERKTVGLRSLYFASVYRLRRDGVEGGTEVPMDRRVEIPCVRRRLRGVSAEAIEMSLTGRYLERRQLPFSELYRHCLGVGARPLHRQARGGPVSRLTSLMRPSTTSCRGSPRSRREAIRPQLREPRRLPRRTW
jgi:hypothetical protein